LAAKAQRDPAAMPRHVVSFRRRPADAEEFFAGEPAHCLTLL
jgi:hypothetical protein